MKRKAFSIMIAVVVFLSVVPLAQATPTNTHTYSNFPVHGGSSQYLGSKTCSDKVYFDYEITYLDLAGQAHISFRPYLGNSNSTTKLLQYAMNIANTTPAWHAFYDYNLSALEVGKTISLKASIPSTSTSVESYFSGSFTF